MKIVLIDTDQVLSEEVRSFLSLQQFICEVESNFIAAFEKISLYEYDCILIGLDSSKNSSFRLLNQLNTTARSEGILIYSRQASLEDKLNAFELGADDFIEAPFNLYELTARINAIIRRKKFNTKNKLYFANLVIDFQLKKVFVWNNPLNLTRKEYEILLYLIGNKNRIVSKDRLIEYLWGNEAESLDSYDFLFAHIKNLRKKLKDAKAEIEIKNSYKMGYQIIEL